MSNLREKILSLEPNSNTSNQTALVDGVYITSQAVRRQALSFIWAKYNMLPDNLTQSLGRLYDAVEEIYLPDKNEKSLFNYTHDKSSVYSRSIAEKNLTVKDGNIQRSVTETPRDAYNSWYRTPYQNRDYYNVFESSKNNNEYSESLSAVYEDFNKNSLQPILSKVNDILGFSSKTKGNFQIIPSENKFDGLITNIENAELKLKENKRPKKQDYYEDGKLNEDKYDEALKSWKEKTGKERRKNRKDAREEIRENENFLNNEYIAEPSNILTKTSKLFKENKIDSLIGRFYGDTPKINSKPEEYIDTARSKYGNSHGKNLLKKNKLQAFGYVNNYHNPYCRVWTYHHQYGTSKDKLIRPFFDEKGSIKNIEDSELIKYFRSENGGEYLHDYSVLKNGFVKITPDNLGNSKYDTKRCMFSIENLAWKDVRIENELSKDQIGPNGGRIMWFPPYDLSFQESSQAQWNETNFIGRGEPIYTYTNTKRTGSLSFTLLIDHPSIMNVFDKRSEKDIDEDNDILRFFAGCEIPTLLNIPQPTENSNNNITEPEGENITTNDEGGKEITFSVYFPNNYSGHYYNKINIDHEWVEYILKGHGINARNTNHTYGYEITNNKGISDDNPQGKYCNKNGKTATYYYRFDDDICSILSDTNNYKDTKSFQLNSTRDKNTLSFLEFITLIEKNEKYNSLREEVKNIKDIGECIVEVYGVATNQDDPNSAKLAERRKNTLSDYITKNINKIGGTIRGEISGDIIIEDVKGDKDVNSKKSKKGRRVDVKIKYNLPAIEAQNNVDNEATKEESATKNEQNNSNTGNVSKYNESDYFLNLEKIDNFAYQKIKEKIKYFEPAYHSISPEGFNSRLTFLHQCTRQGHTLERGENDIANIYSTAGNMAFGRPPFCVLRIGDFINTKILIRSLNIVYQNGNGMQWDMNPEGVGVQPMFAKVTLQIEIIGGQSLDAPVSRLNNAVSFNYYANTGVYDNRADRAIYNGSGITYSNLYEPQKYNN